MLSPQVLTHASIVAWTHHVIAETDAVRRVLTLTKRVAVVITTYMISQNITVVMVLLSQNSHLTTLVAATPTYAQDLQCCALLEVLVYAPDSKRCAPPGLATHVVEEILAQTAA